MNSLIITALSGGLLIVCILIHILANIFYRFLLPLNKYACIIYGIIFIPYMMICHFTFLQLLISVSYMIVSYYYIDTYHLAYLIVLYKVKPREMFSPIKESVLKGDGTISFKLNPFNHKTGFNNFIQTSNGKIITTTINQIAHLICLFILVYFSIKNL